LVPLDCVTPSVLEPAPVLFAAATPMPPRGRDLRVAAMWCFGDGADAGSAHCWSACAPRWRHRWAVVQPGGAFTRLSGARCTVAAKSHHAKRRWGEPSRGGSARARECCRPHPRVSHTHTAPHAMRRLWWWPSVRCYCSASSGP